MPPPGRKAPAPNMRAAEALRGVVPVPGPRSESELSASRSPKKRLSWAPVIENGKASSRFRRPTWLRALAFSLARACRARSASFIRP